MIKVTEDIFLKPIKSSDCDFLFSLMQEIYPPAYEHFWKDKGSWYVKTQYNKQAVLKTLSDKKADYYFVVYKDKIVGNFRFVWDENLDGLTLEKQVKLHLLYLHPITHGKGIGKKLLSWLENLAIKKGYKTIWLDAMNEQPQAFEFYKNLGYQYHSHTFLPFDLLHDEVRKMSQVYKKLS